MNELLRGMERRLKRSVARSLRLLLGSSVASPPSRETVRSILVIRQHNQLGDMLCVVPLLRSLRQSYPGAFIALLASPGNRDVMFHNRYLDEVITYDKFRFLTGIRLRVGEIFRFRRELRTHAFDLVLVPSTVSTSFTSDALAWFSGAPFRVGAGSLSGAENPSGFFFNLPVDLNWSTDPHRHQTLRNLDVARGLVEPTDDFSHEMTLTAEEIAHGSDFVAKLREKGRPIVVLHPGAGKPPNRWSWDRFVALAERLIQEWGATILITVGPMDTDVKSLIYNALSERSYLIENQPIRHVASILFSVDLLVSNDTGIMHVGAAVGTPVVSLFGPTDARQWAPLGDEFCYVMAESGDISDISLDVVIQAVSQSLERRNFIPYGH